MSLLIFLLSLTPAHASRTPLYVAGNELLLGFNPKGPDLSETQRDRVKFSAAFFQMLLEKSDKTWRSGKYFCILPDGDEPVGEHIAREAKAYGVALLHDRSGKNCPQN